MKKHFLNNLIYQLNCISRIAAMENAAETMGLIKQLVNQIRYKVGREGQILTVQEELKAVEDFLGIFKRRFGGRFQCNMDIESSCLGEYIPHYTMMTFVENCMYHAFEGIEDIWKLKIALKRDNEYLQMVIEDNGIGFQPGSVLPLDSQNQTYGSIPSTVLRLEKQYGIEGVIKIYSNQQNGTKVTINIPHQGVRKEEKDG